MVVAVAPFNAALQAIRDRAGAVAKLGPPRPGGDLINAAHRSAADVPRLLAAVEAVLELHKPEHADGRNADGDEFDSYECMACDTGGVRDNWPCDTYRAIAAALAEGGES